MPSSVVAVIEGEFRFDPAATSEALARAWPGSSFAAATGRLAALSAGQVAVRDGDALLALVEIDVVGETLDIDWTALEALARVVSVVTGLPRFGVDSSVVLADWANTVAELRPSMSAEALLTIRGDGDQRVGTTGPRVSHQRCRWSETRGPVRGGSGGF